MATKRRHGRPPKAPPRRGPITRRCRSPSTSVVPAGACIAPGPVTSMEGGGVVSRFAAASIDHGPHRIHTREQPGDEPAVVLMHGYPDNHHLYDRLVPLLPDRRVVVFDFLGWGESDKPTDHDYTFANQAGDLDAVTDGLGLDRVVLVPHDASGPAAINWALDHPDRVAAIVALNTFYGDIPEAPLNPPEAIRLFSDPNFARLTAHFAASPTAVPVALRVPGQRFHPGPRGTPAVRPTAVPPVRRRAQQHRPVLGAQRRPHPGCARRHRTSRPATDLPRAGQGGLRRDDAYLTPVYGQRARRPVRPRRRRSPLADP